MVLSKEVQVGPSIYMAFKKDKDEPNYISKEEANIPERIHIIQKKIANNIIDFVNYLGGSDNVIFTKLLDMWESLYDQDDLKQVFSGRFYNWYYGNIVHGIIDVCFGQFIKDPFAQIFCLTKDQYDDALLTIHYIINYYDVNKYEKDYYWDTPVEMIINFMIKPNVPFTSDAKQSAKEFYYYLT